MHLSDRFQEKQRLIGIKRVSSLFGKSKSQAGLMSLLERKLHAVWAPCWVREGFAPCWHQVNLWPKKRGPCGVLLLTHSYYLFPFSFVTHFLKEIQSIFTTLGSRLHASPFANMLPPGPFLGSTLKPRGVYRNFWNVISGLYVSNNVYLAAAKHQVWVCKNKKKDFYLQCKLNKSPYKCIFLPKPPALRIWFGSWDLLMQITVQHFSLYSITHCFLTTFIRSATFSFFSSKAPSQSPITCKYVLPGTTILT